MVDTAIFPRSEAIFNHRNVHTDKVLAWEIDKTVLDAHQDIVKLFQGTDILSPFVGGHLKERSQKPFSSEEVFNAESLDALQVIAQERLAIQALYQKWQHLSKSNEKKVVVFGREFPERLVV